MSCTSRYGLDTDFLQSKTHSANCVLSTVTSKTCNEHGALVSVHDAYAITLLPPSQGQRLAHSLAAHYKVCAIVSQLCCEVHSVPALHCFTGSWPLSDRCACRCMLSGCMTNAAAVPRRLTHCCAGANNGDSGRPHSEQASCFWAEDQCGRHQSWPEAVSPDNKACHHR